MSQVTLRITHSCQQTIGNANALNPDGTVNPLKNNGSFVIGGILNTYAGQNGAKNGVYFGGSNINLIDADPRTPGAKHGNTILKVEPTPLSSSVSVLQCNGGDHPIPVNVVIPNDISNVCRTTSTELILKGRSCDITIEFDSENFTTDMAYWSLAIKEGFVVGFHDKDKWTPNTPFNNKYTTEFPGIVDSDGKFTAQPGSLILASYDKFTVLDKDLLALNKDLYQVIDPNDLIGGHAPGCGTNPNFGVCNMLLDS